MAGKAAFLGLIAVLLLVSGSCSRVNELRKEYCKNETLATVQSPSGEWEAVIFNRVCGALDEDTTQVSLLKSGESLGDSPGNVLTLKGKSEKGRAPVAAVGWTNANQLIVNYDKERVVEFAAGPTARSVIIFYRHIEPNARQTQDGS